MECLLFGQSGQLALIWMRPLSVPNRLTDKLFLLIPSEEFSVLEFFKNGFQ